MRLLIPLGAAAVVAAALVVAGAPTAAQTAPPPAFAACRACHTVELDGRNGIGPNLHGVVGRPAGTAPGFGYSPALKGSELRWDESALDEYLASPSQKIPGTRMPISTPDPAKRAAIIAYLKAESAK